MKGCSCYTYNSYKTILASFNFGGWTKNRQTAKSLPNKLRIRYIGIRLALSNRTVNYSNRSTPLGQFNTLLLQSETTKLNAQMFSDAISNHILLNQVHASFLEITFVRLSVCVCLVCVRLRGPRLLITAHLK